MVNAPVLNSIKPQFDPAEGISIYRPIPSPQKVTMLMLETVSVSPPAFCFHMGTKQPNTKQKIQILRHLLKHCNKIYRNHINIPLIIQYHTFRSPLLSRHLYAPTTSARCT